ncbi:NADH:quinone oxidoreductase I, chain G (cl35703 superfamily) [Campylobacter blaseri]|uniref:NADH-quinone oxidoreductase subunit G n=1 Tax=Campylobacter blaseri TaxID=2042961 RepID=A0A2P8R0Z3_9BACT|nr:NADH-quinone oxidoreductase subunit G [Campylobacter blaseri]PSM52166.1 NADH-quinone oxidoreductase subunit G [Campylobacter blaseri]PSM53932.1 NADH-quinone oxidoreductase subunit G [Campylobacter blaseri]QKF85367.1 NADH:quinone oxidoreductase I, chain G (cl35703 superfamily) [Campylobacter blaseri]
MVKITINGKTYKCEEGEQILKIARSNGVFIPAICYLSGCSPTLACRLCMVEADGKRVYSCNAKAKDGMNVITSTPDIEDERKAIMQTYCINHPLECGTCDQSGECELQNFVFHMGVDTQEYAIKDTYKPMQNWGLIDYDPSLCIVCERCVTVCKDKMGNNALKTVPRNSEPFDKSLKETMPKEAFAVWNKFQKSLIGRNDDGLSCDSCGECAAVCPVGALTVSSFKYKSNAWELTKIGASNPHSSDCELIYYDVKPASIEDRKDKIYRVSSDFDFGELNKAARFGFDFHNEKAHKDRIVLERIIKAFKENKIKNIKFNSFITNEEAKMLSILKDKFDVKLVNKEAKKYQEFLKEFSKYSGADLYNGDFDTIKSSDFIISAGSFLRHDAPNISYKLNNALKINKASALYFHPLKDSVVEGYSKNLLGCKHSSNLDIEILLWILQKFGKNLPKWLQDKFDSEFENIKKDILVDKKETQTKIVKKKVKDEDGKEVEVEEEKEVEVVVKTKKEILINVSKYSKMLGLDEEKIDKLLDKKTKFSLIIGEDFITSKNAILLAKLTGLIQKYSEFNVLIIPPRTNSLGVALICELDEMMDGKTLGYNEDGDITLGVHGCDLDAPALNQQEGTFVNLEKRVVPTNPALSYDGYELNDILKALNLGYEYSADYTDKLGSKFKNIKFDDLENSYDNSGKSHRGYKLNIKHTESIEDEFEIISKNELIDEENTIYKANPIGQFSKFTNRASALNSVAKLYAGEEFLKTHSLEDKDLISIDRNGKTLSLRIELDNKTDGAYLPFFDDKIDVDEFFDGSRYSKVSLKRSEV